MRRLLLVALLTLVALPASAPATPIVGGAETQAKWPWMVYLEQGRNELEVLEGNYCGGTLIDATWVMTAGHCIDNALLDPLTTTVVIGRHSIANDEGERIQAKRIFVHEEYADGGPDIALIELERAPAGPDPIKIAAAGDEALYAPGVMATILGWGHTSDGGDSSDVLKEAQLPIVADEPCGKTYAAPDWGWRADEMICAGYPQGGTDTCQGDSGGPLIVPAPGGGFRQVGITSFGEGCAQPGWPGVYTEVAGAKVREWVRARVPNAIASPSPSAATAPPAGSAAPEPGPSSTQAPASEPAPGPASAPPARRATPKASSKALKRCLKKAKKNKRKQRACRRAAAKRKRR